MSTKPERPSAGLMFVFRQDAVAGFPVDFFVEQGEHPVVDQVGRLEADGWLMRVYVNHEVDEA